ncbi:unnamed protein product [Protopolystoma xenopodis]|uniref:Uncharacterized protein n=1 Tax=Protopolystoma xenopodis TaxID=117903 RepID=A0A448XC03_9PLAT|nr:unnamed protein product [Protopolystoma xenopodis]
MARLTDDAGGTSAIPIGRIFKEDLTLSFPPFLPYFATAYSNNDQKEIPHLLSSDSPNQRPSLGTLVSSQQGFRTFSEPGQLLAHYIEGWQEDSVVMQQIRLSFTRAAEDENPAEANFYLDELEAAEDSKINATRTNSDPQLDQRTKEPESHSSLKARKTSEPLIRGPLGQDHASLETVLTSTMLSKTRHYDTRRRHVPKMEILGSLNFQLTSKGEIHESMKQMMSSGELQSHMVSF